VKDYEMVFFSACNQMDGQPTEKMSIGEAVGKGLVANQTLGYYLARVHQFMIKVGVNPKKLRFRQHMSNEMAHYAQDCWDAECLTSYGWIECVGNADRSCYDLNQHTQATGVKLVAERRLAEPKQIDVTECQPKKDLLGKQFKKESKAIIRYLEELDAKKSEELEVNLTNNGMIHIEVENRKFDITAEMVTVKRYQKTVHVEDLVPSVIEPSFGIGRIMYAVFEHNFKVREGSEQRTYFSLPPLVAPLKCSILPLSGNPEFAPFVQQLSDLLREHDISHKVDDSSGSIGRRYARTDEIAIPFGITIDFDTLKAPHTATLRERDSLLQIRAPIEDLPKVVSDLCRAKTTWDAVIGKYPRFEQQEATKDKGDE